MQVNGKSIYYSKAALTGEAAADKYQEGDRLELCDDTAQDEGRLNKKG